MGKIVVEQFRNRINTVDYALIIFDDEKHLVCLSTKKYLGQVGFDEMVDIVTLTPCGGHYETEITDNIDFVELALVAQKHWLQGTHLQDIG